MSQPSPIQFTRIAPLGASGSPRFIDKTTEEILADLMLLASAAPEDADMIILPNAQYSKIENSRMSPESGFSILEAFFQVWPKAIGVAPWYALAGAGLDNTDRMICYKRPPNLEILPGNPSGVVIHEPSEFSWMDEI